MADKAEEKDVTLAQVKQGVQLRAGHQVVIIVSDAHAPPPPSESAGQGAGEDSADSKSEPAEET